MLLAIVIPTKFCKKRKAPTKTYVYKPLLTNEGKFFSRNFTVLANTREEYDFLKSGSMSKFSKTTRGYYRVTTIFCPNSRKTEKSRIRWRRCWNIQSKSCRLILPNQTYLPSVFLQKYRKLPIFQKSTSITQVNNQFPFHQSHFCVH